MATENKVHEGHNIKRIREILGVKQDALAIDLGLTQQAVSLLEQRETLDAPTLDKVAKALGVTPETIKSFDEENAINFISNTFNQSGLFNRDCTLNFNPIDKIIELYERMLKEKDILIEKLMSEKKI